MMKVGDIVKYNPRWCTEEERDLTFVIVEERDHRDDPSMKVMRYLIRATHKVGAFYYSEVVDEEMLEPTGMSVTMA